MSSISAARHLVDAVGLRAVSDLGSAWATPRDRGLDPYPQAAVAYAAVVDGELLWGRNLDVHRAPASLTKLLTALVLLDSDWHPDAVLERQPQRRAHHAPAGRPAYRRHGHGRRTL